MDFDPSYLVAAVAGAGVALASVGWRRFLRRFRHEHEFDHMGSDGAWRCATCDAPKKRGT